MFRFARTSSARAVAASANVAGPVARAAVAGARVATTGTQTSAVASRAGLSFFFFFPLFFVSHPAAFPVPLAPPLECYGWQCVTGGSVVSG